MVKPFIFLVKNNIYDLTKNINFADTKWVVSSVGLVRQPADDRVVRQFAHVSIPVQPWEHCHMHFINILYSQKYHKIYTGYSIDPNRRLQFHNDEGNKRYTKRYQPWEIIYTEEFETKQAALIREKQLKTSRGRAFVWELVAKIPGDKK